MILVTLQKVLEISKNRMALSLSLKTKVIKRGMIIKQKKCKKGQVTENYLQKRLTWFGSGVNCAWQFWMGLCSFSSNDDLKTPKKCEFSQISKSAWKLTFIKTSNKYSQQVRYLMHCFLFSFLNALNNINIINFKLTLAPSLAHLSPIFSPIPREAPVMYTVLPANFL